MSPASLLPEVILQEIFTRYIAGASPHDGGQTLVAVSRQWRIVAISLMCRSITVKYKRYRIGADTHIDLSPPSAITRAVSLCVSDFTHTLTIHCHGLSSREIQQKLMGDGFGAAQWPRLTAVTMHGLPTEQPLFGDLRAFFLQYAPNLVAVQVAATVSQPPDVSILRSLDPTSALLSVDVQQIGADIPQDLASRLTRLTLDNIDVMCAWSRIPTEFPHVTSLTLSFANRTSSTPTMSLAHCDCAHSTHALEQPRTRFCEHFAGLAFPSLRSLTVEHYPCPIANILRSVPAAQIACLNVSGTVHSLESLDVQLFPSLTDCSIDVCVDQTGPARVSLFEEPDESDQMGSAARIIGAALSAHSLLRNVHLAISRTAAYVPLKVSHVGSKCLQSLTLSFAAKLASLVPVLQSSPSLRRLSVGAVTGSFAPTHCSSTLEELEVCDTAEMGIREYAALASLAACVPSLLRLTVDDEPSCRHLDHVAISGVDIIAGSPR